MKIINFIVFGCLGFMLFVVLSTIPPMNRFIRSFVVTSGSMAPTVPAGSLVLVHPIEAGTARTGDIIAFTLPGNPKTTVLHRIKTISKSPLTYHTKGDNNNAADTWTVPAANIVGSFMYGIPFIGYAAAFIRTKLGYALVIGIPVLYLIFTQIRLIIDGIEEVMEKRTKKASMIHLLFMVGLIAGCISAFGVRHVSALFVAQATIQGISISAQTGVTPSPTITPTITATPTPTPTPTPTQKCTGTIIQENSVNSQTTVISDASTGNNTIDGSTGGSSSVITGDASASAVVVTTGGNNVVTCSQ